MPGGEPAARESHALRREIAGETSPLRGRLYLAAVMAAAAAGLFLCYWWIVARPAKDPRPAPSVPSASRPARPVPTVLIVENIAGEAQVAPPGEATFRKAVAGEALRPGTRIATSGSSVVTLRGADGIRLDLLGSTAASIEAIGPAESRLRLTAGMIDARVEPDATRLFQLDLDEKTRTTARTHDADFVAIKVHDGRGSVGASRGSVIIDTRDREVTIHTGEMARITDAGTSDAMRIPRELYLKVEWPGPVSRQPALPVRGRTDPGTRLRVEGREVSVDDAGRFATEVPAQDGVHVLHLEVEDVQSRRKAVSSPPIRVKTRVPVSVPPVEWPAGK